MGEEFYFVMRYEWMNERTNERMNERMNEWMNEWMNECHEWINIWYNFVKVSTVMFNSTVGSE